MDSQAQQERADFEMMWSLIWHRMFCNLPVDEYNFVQQFAYEVFITGMAQQRYNQRAELEKIML